MHGETVKVSWIHIRWQPSNSMRNDRQAGGQTDMMKLIITFCNFA